MTDAMIAVRTLHFATTFAASGTALFVTLISAPSVASIAEGDFARLQRSAKWLCLCSLVLALFTGAAWLVLLAADILDKPVLEVLLNGGAADVLRETRFGWIWSGRLLLALALGALTVWPRLPAIRLLVAAAFVASLAFAGHAGAAGDAQRVSDIAHLLAAGAWLGSLPAFAMALVAARRADTKPWHAFIVIATHRFSIMGMLCVVTLLASGIGNSWYLLGNWSDLWTTGYGCLIAVKIALFALMTAVAIYNKASLTPRLPEAFALRTLARASLVETGLGLAALAVVGALGTMEPTAHAHLPTESIPPDAAFVHIHDPEAMADVTVDPGRVGSAHVSIRVSREDFSPYPAQVVTISFEPPKPGTGNIKRTAVAQPNGTWSVNGIELGRAGIWTLRVTITSRLGKAIVLDAPIVIER